MLFQDPTDKKQSKKCVSDLDRQHERDVKLLCETERLFTTVVLPVGTPVVCDTQPVHDVY